MGHSVINFMADSMDFWEDYLITGRWKTLFTSGKPIWSLIFIYWLQFVRYIRDKSGALKPSIPGSIWTFMLTVNEIEDPKILCVYVYH